MKYIKIIALNILFIILFLFILNFNVYYIAIKKDPNSKNLNLTKIISLYKDFLSRDISEKETYSAIIQNKYNWYRRVENPNSKKPPIILFGCSFTWGTNLGEEETFSAKLGKLTQRPIYNRAYGGWGVQHMLYQLKQDGLYDNFKNSIPPEYVIYTFIRSQYTRINSPIVEYYIPCYLVFYKYNKNGDFELKKNNFINSKFIIQHYLMNNFIYPVLKLSQSYQEKCDKTLFAYFMEAKKELNKHFPNTKFVIFFYERPYNNFLIYKLIKNNFIVIINEDTGIDLNEPKYTLPDTHPSALYWEEAVPKIIKQLQL